MSRTVADPRFRAILVSLVRQDGRSQNAIARDAHVSASYLSEVVNGNKTPSAEVAAALDEALDAGGRLVDLVALAASDEDHDQLATAAANPKATPATIESLARVLAGQRHLDDTMGSAALRGPIAAQLPIITTMVAHAHGPQRRPLLYEAAQWAQFAGWLHLATADWTGARTWLARGLEWTSEVGDPDLTATVLSYQAHLAWLTNQWGAAVGLSHAALRDGRAYPGQRAYDAFQAARGHAALGEVDEARRLVDVADGIADEAAAWTGAVPAWQYYRAPWLWSLERGLVWLYAGRHDKTCAPTAVAELQAGVAGVPAEMRGADWFAEYLTQLAGAHLQVGKADEAVAVLAEARLIADRTQSRRVLGLVQDRERRLRLVRAA